MGKGHISSESATPPSQGCGPQNSPVFGVPFYLCVQSLPQNYHIWRSNTYGEEACLKGVSHAPPKGGKALVFQLRGLPSLPIFSFLCPSIQAWTDRWRDNGHQCIMLPPYVFWYAPTPYGNFVPKMLRFQIVNFEKCLDLVIQVRGHSRSLKVVPLDTIL